MRSDAVSPNSIGPVPDTGDITTRHGHDDDMMRIEKEASKKQEQLSRLKETALALKNVPSKTTKLQEKL